MAALMVGTKVESIHQPFEDESVIIIKFWNQRYQTVSVIAVQGCMSKIKESANVDMWVWIIYSPNDKSTAICIYLGDERQEVLTKLDDYGHSYDAMF